jgi:hypothetical protein
VVQDCPTTRGRPGCARGCPLGATSLRGCAGAGDPYTRALLSVMPSPTLAAAGFATSSRARRPMRRGSHRGTASKRAARFHSTDAAWRSRQRSSLRRARCCVLPWPRTMAREGRPPPIDRPVLNPDETTLRVCYSRLQQAPNRGDGTAHLQAGCSAPARLWRGSCLGDRWSRLARRVCTPCVHGAPPGASPGRRGARDALRFLGPGSTRGPAGATPGRLAFLRPPVRRSQHGTPRPARHALRSWAPPVRMGPPGRTGTPGQALPIGARTRPHLSA